MSIRTVRFLTEGLELFGARLNRTASLICIAMLAISIGGCASWSDRTTDKPESKLPTLNENSKSLILEVEFVPIDADIADPDSMQSLWQWVDETSVPTETRRNWFENGIRAGRVTNSERLRLRLDTMKSKLNAVDKFLSGAEIASEVSQGGKRIPTRFGRRYELPLREPTPGSHVTLVRLAGETIGRTLQDPQYLFALTTTQGTSPKQAELSLRPEIQFGDMKQQWVSSESAIRIDQKREAWSLKELSLDLNVTEGDLYMFTATSPHRGLGTQMFVGNRADSMEQQVVVLIRIDRIPTATSKL